MTKKKAFPGAERFQEKKKWKRESSCGAARRKYLCQSAHKSTEKGLVARSTK